MKIYIILVRDKATSYVFMHLQQLNIRLIHFYLSNLFPLDQGSFRFSMPPRLTYICAYFLIAAGTNSFILFLCLQEVTARIFMPLTQCPSKRCVINKTKGNLILQLRASKFLKFQEVKIYSQ